LVGFYLINCQVKMKAIDHGTTLIESKINDADDVDGDTALLVLVDSQRSDFQQVQRDDRHPLMQGTRVTLLLMFLFTLPTLAVTFLYPCDHVTNVLRDTSIRSTSTTLFRQQRKLSSTPISKDDEARILIGFDLEVLAPNADLSQLIPIAYRPYLRHLHPNIGVALLCIPPSELSPLHGSTHVLLDEIRGNPMIAYVIILQDVLNCSVIYSPGNTTLT
jgi:hypothetical protein